MTHADRIVNKNEKNNKLKKVHVNKNRWRKKTFSEKTKTKCLFFVGCSKHLSSLLLSFVLMFSLSVFLFVLMIWFELRGLVCSF